MARSSMWRTALPYTEVAPPADLAAVVDRFWLRTTLRAEARSHRVLPDGCVDVIVHADRGTAEVVGTMTRAALVPAEPASMVAVRFRPGTASALTRDSLAALTDRDADLAAIDRASGAVVDQIARAPSVQAQLAALVAWVRARLATAPGPDPLVAEAVRRLSGAARVEQVARALGVTRQHLARRFRDEVGLTPKELARVARMQRAVAAIGAGGELAQVAAELGLFDQAHLAHELRALVGVAPSALAREPPVALTHLYAPGGFHFSKPPSRTRRSLAP